MNPEGHQLVEAPADLGPLVEAMVEKIGKERKLIDFIEYVTRSNRDWDLEAKEFF